ncbi:MAG: ATP-binding protein [Campylobacterota bacterium]|nr:ATP-binding protein [Campylobacterota bacterium]
MNNNEEKLINELKSQKEQAEEMLSRILLPILITSKETRKIVYANPYAQKQYETTLDVLVGMEVSEFYTNDAQREKILSSLQDTGTVENLEMHWKTIKGNTFYGLLSLTDITFNNEKCFMGMVKDITLQKEQDMKLARQSKMEALGEMISNVAHQWRQPLNAITVSASGLVLQQELDILDSQTMIDELHLIEKEATFLSKTIDDFRDLIDDANKHEKLKFSLNSTIAAIMSINSYSFIVQKELCEDIEILGISNKLVKSISNILQNSDDAFIKTSQNKRVVILKTYLRNNNAIIEISDNAGGIDNTIIDKIFEPYFTTYHQSPGKGLGLFNSQKMIQEDMNGHLSVCNQNINYEDKEYNGVCFKIEIPLS